MSISTRTAPPPPRPSPGSSLRPAVSAVVIAAAAAAVGVLADAGTLLPGPAAWLDQLLAPWVLLAFAAGRAVRGPAWAAPPFGALAGAAAVAIGLAGSTALGVLDTGRFVPAEVVSYDGRRWVVVVAAGLIAGAAGACSRRRSPAVAAAAWGTAAGVLLGEGAATTVGLEPFPEVPVGPLEVALALLLVVAGSRGGRWRWTATVALLVGAAVALGPAPALQAVR